MLNCTIFSISFLSFLRFPWEWRDPLLYPISALIEFVLNFWAVTTCACVLSLYVATCYLFMAFAEDIKHEMNDLNEICSAKGGPVQFKSKISKIIQLHSNTKQLSLSSVWNFSTFHHGNGFEFWKRWFKPTLKHSVQQLRILNLFAIWFVFVITNDSYISCWYVKLMQIFAIFTFRPVHDFTQIFEFILVFYFLWSVSTICSNLLSIQTELVEYSEFSLSLTFLKVFFSFFHSVSKR